MTAEKLYSLFREKPPVYATITGRLAELRKVQEKKYDEGKKNIVQDINLGKYEEALEECKLRMKFFAKSSNEYEYFHRKKSQIEDYLRSRKEGK